MKLAFVIFDGMTALDFVGVYDPVVRLKTMGFIEDLQWDICALRAEVADHTQLIFCPTKVGESLRGYDLLIVPGGFGTRRLVHDHVFIEWLKTAGDCPLKTSVCTGSLLLGAAGFLQGKQATTHPTAFRDLERYCAQVVSERIVDEGDVITARGVTSALDLGLYLCEKFVGVAAKEQIRLQMDYATE